MQRQAIALCVRIAHMLEGRNITEEHACTEQFLHEAP